MNGQIILKIITQARPNFEDLMKKRLTSFFKKEKHYDILFE